MRPLDPRLLRHAPGARPFVLSCAVIGVATAALVVAQADLIARVVTDAFVGGAALPGLTGAIAVLAAVVVGRAVLAWLAETTAHRASAAVRAQLRSAVLRQVLDVGPGRRDDVDPVRLAVLATRGIDGMDGYFSRYLPQLLIAAVVPAAVGARILFADWTAALIVAATVPLIPVFMILIGLYTRRDARRQWRTLSVLGNHFLDLVTGLAVLTAFGRARAQLRTLREITDRYRVRTMRTLRVALLSALVLELLATLSVALVAVSIGLRLAGGTLDLRTALVVLILAPEVYQPLRAVGARFHDSAEGAAAAEEVIAVLGGGTARGGRPAPDPAVVAVSLDDVTVPGRGAPVLDGFSLTVEPGEVLGLAGPSGVGKSTVLDLLLGWYPPRSGAVRIGAVDLSDVDPAAWRERVAWVPQRPMLLDGTVADNIRLGRPDATAAQVAAAARVAALDVPLDTRVGELGGALSTGQRRRVALARAVLTERPLLLLDEPTEGVDAGTEAAIVAALPSVLDGRTAVVVSHHDSVLACCDRVVTLAAPPATATSVAPVEAAPVHRTVPVAPAAPVLESGADAETGGWSWLRTAIAPHRWRLASACLAGTAAAGCAVGLTATAAWLIASAALHPPILTLMVAIVAVRFFGLARGVFRYVERLLSHDVALRALADLRVRVWSALVRIGPGVAGRLRGGDLLDRVVSDVDRQQDVLVRGVVPVVGVAVVGSATAVGLGVLLPAAGICTAIGLAVAGLLAPAASVAAARGAERRSAPLRARVASTSVELLRAAPDLVAFGAGARLRAALARSDAALTATLRRAAVATAVGTGLAVVATGAVVVVNLLLGIAALRAGQLSGPGLAVLTLTPLAAAELVLGLPETAVRLLATRHSAARLAELDRTPTPVAEPAHPSTVDQPSSLAATGLTVRWPGAAVDAVRDVTLRLDPGQRRLVLTGASGTGKSTTVAALLRHLDPVAGRIEIDGIDARRLRADDVRAAIAWCGTDAHLFDSTLRENLLLARPDATDGDLRAALAAARLGDWVAALPEGLDSRLGVHGTPVSGGERQRIGLARAILADRPFVVLDEPTAHLDAATAAELAADLERMTRDRVALIVTHRPADFPSVPVLHLPDPAERQVPVLLR